MHSTTLRRSARTCRREHLSARGGRVPAPPPRGGRGAGASALLGGSACCRGGGSRGGRVVRGPRCSPEQRPLTLLQVFGVPDPRYGEAVCAWVRLRCAGARACCPAAWLCLCGLEWWWVVRGLSPLPLPTCREGQHGVEAEELQAWLRGRLAAFKVPKHWKVRPQGLLMLAVDAGVEPQPVLSMRELAEVLAILRLGRQEGTRRRPARPCTPRPQPASDTTPHRTAALLPPSASHSSHPPCSLWIPSPPPPPASPKSLKWRRRQRRSWAWRRRWRAE